MLEHEKLWNAIDTLASVKGYSTSGLAKKAGLDPTVFNKSKRITGKGRNRWPTTESISKILAVTDYSMGQFVSLIQSNDTGLMLSKSKLTKPSLSINFTSNHQEHKLQARNDATESTYIDNTSFLVQLSTKEYEPLFSKGDTLIVSKTAIPKKKDTVLIQMQDGSALLAKIKKTATHAVHLESINHMPVQYTTIETSTILSINVVIWKRI